ncbi:MAG: hypothetical protein J0H49_34910 [Acidobacteria bacterium]|nr:hypothetical protein [Acidobacteriota bacterium]
MQYRTVTILAGISLLDVCAALDQLETHAADTPARKLAGWMHSSQTPDEAIAAFHPASPSRKMVLLDDGRTRDTILKAAQDADLGRFVEN